MKVVLTVTSIVFVCVGIGVWWLQKEPSSQPADSQPELPSAAATSSNASELAGIDAARQRVDDAKLALQAIIAERKTVEAKLEQAELDVTELERFIEGIEARGEDPADYADEGLEMFQPAFYAYQDAFDEFERVEGMQQAAEEQLAAAEMQLAQMLAASAEK